MLHRQTKIHVQYKGYTRRYLITYEHGRPVCRARRGHVPPRFCEANVKIFNFDYCPPPPDLYCALQVLLMCPPSFHSHQAPMHTSIILHENVSA